LTDLSQINVTVNQSVTVTVVAEDPNNDTLSFSIIGVLPTDAILLNNSNSITITWNGTMEQVGKIKFEKISSLTGKGVEENDVNTKLKVDQGFIISLVYMFFITRYVVCGTCD